MRDYDGPRLQNRLYTRSRWEVIMFEHLNPTPQKPSRVVVLGAPPMALLCGCEMSAFNPHSSALITFARIELHAGGKQASARNKVRFQANAIRVFEQHRVVARRPHAVLRRMNDGGAHLTQQIV